MTKLSVNVNKIATIRNARGGNNPDVLKVALDCERFGADGITVHPRPDERHIRHQDVIDLAQHVKTELNVEGYPDDRFIDLIKKTRPAQATLVPDPPHVLTSNAGWNTVKHQDYLKEVIATIHSFGIRVSIFIAPDIKLIEAAVSTGTDRIELYTESYAACYDKDRENAIAPYIIAAKKAQELGLGINAGHDLDLENLRYMKEQISFIDEVSIGHALVCDALYYGLENTVQMYQRRLRELG
jgi:pyridoxine 5-phosphate synthase